MSSRICSLGLALILVSSLLAQERPQKKKPVLIRDDAPPVSEELEFVLDPRQAEEAVEVGDFYMRRKNLPAAESRFRQAIRFQPTWPTPYERLIKALQKQKEFQKALDACDLFLLTNPDSDQVEHFKKLAAQIQEKI